MNKSDIVCSKGIHQCNSSIRRAQALTEKFIEEVHDANLLKKNQPRSVKKFKKKSIFDSQKSNTSPLGGRDANLELTVIENPDIKANEPTSTVDENSKIKNEENKVNLKSKKSLKKAIFETKLGFDRESISYTNLTKKYIDIMDKAKLKELV